MIARPSVMIGRAGMERPFRKWSTTDLAATTLSNSNRTATSGSGNGGVRSEYSIGEGLLYFEATVSGVSAAADVRVGISNLAASLAGSQNTNVAAMRTTDGNFANNGALVSTGFTAGWSNGQTVRIAINTESKMFWVGRDSVWGGAITPDGFTGGRTYVLSGELYKYVGHNTPGCVFTLNETPVYSPPPGFRAV